MRRRKTPRKQTPIANLATHPAWIDPTWEQLPDSWPSELVSSLRRNGVETWEQLCRLSAAQTLLWKGFGRVRLARLRELVADCGRSLRMPAPMVHQMPAMLMPVEIDGPPDKDLSGLYFVQSGSFIKIGIANNVCNRLRSFTNSNPHELIGIAWIPERDLHRAFCLEQELHRRFGPYRHRLEWFHENILLWQYIGEHAIPWPAEQSR